jgi:hypothetical protein
MGPMYTGPMKYVVRMTMNMDYQSIGYIIALNKKLSHRTKARFPYMYKSIVTLLSVLIFSLFLLASSSEIIVIEKGGEYTFILSVFMLLFLSDAMLTMIRYQNSTLVEPYHYSLLPVSARAIVLWNIFQMLYAYKSIIYLSILFAMSLYLVLHSYYFSIPILILLIITYVVMINVLLYVCYLLFYKLLLRTRNIAVAIVVLAVGAFNVINATGHLVLFQVLIMIEIPGRGVSALMSGEIVNALISILSMCAITLLGILLLRVLSRHMYPAFVTPNH